jgi:acyl-CoA reductase-like NAD-dependent aldehyde dehydrogenase
MLVRQAFDGAQIAEIQVDSEASVAEKLDRAARCFANRAGWLPPYRRIEILRRLARLLEREYEALAMQTIDRCADRGRALH